MMEIDRKRLIAWAAEFADLSDLGHPFGDPWTNLAAHIHGQQKAMEGPLLDLLLHPATEEEIGSVYPLTEIEEGVLWWWNRGLIALLGLSLINASQVFQDGLASADKEVQTLVARARSEASSRKWYWQN